ncbi:hypothetical protein LJC26_06105 [Desulfovibrio sp. OttesenSCG-928-O18]|nr:hypothetical protein [Desulfovibrio sp. OttesenSCG-928-O18]
MSAQTTAHSPEFQAIIIQVETALAQAVEDARELAERTGTPLVVRNVSETEAEPCECKAAPGHNSPG